MKYFLILNLLFIVSCASKPKLIKVVSSYKYGLEVAENSDDLIYEFTPVGDFCIRTSSNISNQQSLISSRSNNTHVRHSYNVDEIILWLNKLNNCNDKSHVIYLNNIESKIWYFERMRNNGYSLQIKISANKACKNESVEFSSTSKKSISKSGKLIGLGVISENKKQSLIAAVIVSAYYEAISNIHDQIQEQCN